MKVILLQDIKTLGRRGEVKEVAEGYARNFLVPKGLVAPATEANLRTLAKEKQAVQSRELHEENEARQVADRLEGLKIAIKAKTGESGRLFGSITSKDIAEAVRKATKIELDRKKIELPEGLKQLGRYEVLIKFHRAVTATITVDVEEAGD